MFTRALSERQEIDYHDNQNVNELRIRKSKEEKKSDLKALLPPFFSYLNKFFMFKVFFFLLEKMLENI